MAVFEPTEKEKAAASYLEWDDAELGKFTKYCGLVMAANAKDTEGLHRVAAASCAMQLVSVCLESNADTLKLDLDGHTSRGVSTGDWVLTVKRKRKPKTAKATSPVTNEITGQEHGTLPDVRTNGGVRSGRRLVARRFDKQRPAP